MQHMPEQDKAQGLTKDLHQKELIAACFNIYIPLEMERVPGQFNLHTNSFPETHSDLVIIKCLHSCLCLSNSSVVHCFVKYQIQCLANVVIA